MKNQPCVAIQTCSAVSRADQAVTVPARSPRVCPADPGADGARRDRAAEPAGHRRGQVGERHDARPPAWPRSRAGRRRSPGRSPATDIRCGGPAGACPWPARAAAPGAVTRSRVLGGQFGGDPGELAVDGGDTAPVRMPRFGPGRRRSAGSGPAPTATGPRGTAGRRRRCRPGRRARGRRPGRRRSRSSRAAEQAPGGRLVESLVVRG